jgi:hypothetical protein
MPLHRKAAHRFNQISKTQNGDFIQSPHRDEGQHVRLHPQASEMAIACLVSREWRSITAPSLWRLLNLFVPRKLSNKSLSALIQPRNGILPCVRELRVSCGDEQIRQSCSQDDETFVQLVVAALPRNCLKSFNSFFAVSSPFVLHLLQCHRKLDSLFVIVGDSPHGTTLLKLDTASNPLWLSPCL